MLRVTVSLGLCWAMGAVASPYAADGKALVYANAKGVEVTVVALRPRSDKKVLIRVDGTRTVYDGRIALHDVSASKSREDYTDVVRKGYVTFFGRSSYGSSMDYEVVVPGMHDSMKVSLDKKKAESVDANAIVEAFYGRRATPSADAKVAETEDSRIVAAATAGAKAECKMELATTIDWKSFGDEAVRKLALGEVAAAALRAIESVCDDESGREEIAKRIQTVSVVAGRKLDFSLSGKTLKVSVAKDGASGVWDAGREYLLQKM